MKLEQKHLILPCRTKKERKSPIRLQRKKVILYFYPKDLTSGCTKQACGFKERYPLITEKGAVVIGISKDSVKSTRNL